MPSTTLAPRKATAIERRIIQGHWWYGQAASVIAENLPGDYSDCDGGVYGYVRAVLDAYRRDVVRP
jgi:hypothetical protein